MRPTALIPALFCAAALILSFLCLFAGHKRGFMEDYHMLTLNTSKLGEDFINNTLSESSGPLSDIWDAVPDSIQDGVGDAVGVATQRLGIEDFYSAHILDYCHGQYVPSESPNATVSDSEIHKNVTGCSNQTAMFYFDPNQILEEALNKSGLDVTLDDLEWPQDIQRGLDALRMTWKAAFVLYCIAIALIGISLLAALPALVASGRLVACLNLMLAILAFLAIGLASALTTAVIVKGADVINQYGNDIGVEAHRGGKFLAITWAATGAMLVALVLWSLEICFGHRRRTTYVPPKHG